MKKLFAIMIALVCQPPLAQASDDGFFFKPYVGFDLQKHRYLYNDKYDTISGQVDNNQIFESEFNGANVHVGARLHRNLGIEAGYYQTREEDTSVAIGDNLGNGNSSVVDLTARAKIKGATFDVIGYLPLDKDNRFELVGTAGVIWSKIDITSDVVGFGKIHVGEEDFQARGGGGLNYNITDHVSARALVRYQKADLNDLAKDAWTYSAGLNYTF